jgi:predicted CopG family antitoxin
MKSILVNISDEDFDALQIMQHEISFDVLKQKWHLQNIKKKRALLAVMAQQEGLDTLNEADIFSMVKEDKAAYPNSNEK